MQHLLVDCPFPQQPLINVRLLCLPTSAIPIPISVPLRLFFLAPCHHLARPPLPSRLLACLPLPLAAPTRPRCLAPPTRPRAPAAASHSPARPPPHTVGSNTATLRGRRPDKAPPPRPDGWSPKENEAINMSSRKRTGPPTPFQDISNDQDLGLYQHLMKQTKPSDLFFEFIALERSGLADCEGEEFQHKLNQGAADDI
ncbi:uncharacterized protein LOC104582516 [Brachypodium distachyon]|uniref:uncharacterized protein LOC104582516 n=1 Tax=Brachypodium distachyon TaxID=15368 RepID=UPI00071E0E7B|nr:uncharacterized protein LOC104582516 [Brachypodium distachyon]|eukprot:XP_014753991.1 uncharacterized protein LOC104582516 [Brachypodium distachyon]